MTSLPDQYKVIRAPTNTGWIPSHVNGGLSQVPLVMVLYTSVTASSRALAYCNTFGLESGNLVHYYIDWTKRLELSFIMMRYNSDTEVVARVQLKEVNTEGVLGAPGIGLQISNLTVVGEAYGTALQTTGTLKTLTNDRCVRVKIVLTSTSVEFWVDGVLVGSLTGTAVPVAVGTAFGCLVVSIVNGVTGGVDARIYIGNIEVVQVW